MFLWDVRTKWKYLGIALDIDAETLEEIERNHHFVIADCFTNLVSRWLRHTEPLPTRTALARALQSPQVGAPDLAHKLYSIGNPS